MIRPPTIILEMLLLVCRSRPSPCHRSLASDASVLGSRLRRHASCRVSLGILPPFSTEWLLGTALSTPRLDLAKRFGVEVRCDSDSAVKALGALAVRSTAW